MDARKGHPPRLRGWDYGNAAAYFVTMNVAARRRMLSRIDGEQLHLTPAGEIVERCWRELPSLFPVRLDVHVVMPDHLHAVIHLPRDDPAQSRPAAMQRPDVLLGKVVRAWKARSTFEIRRTAIPEFGWQSRFYDRIIRHRDELDMTRRYIVENPIRWCANQAQRP